MLLSRHRRQIIDAGSFAADAPYAEQAARKEGRLDGALLGAWGRISPYLLSALASALRGGRRIWNRSS